MTQNDAERAAQTTGRTSTGGPSAPRRRSLAARIHSLREMGPSAAAYHAGWAITAKIPTPLARWLFIGLADAASRRGRRPQQLRRNLARVVGAENVTDELVRASVRSYLRYWREAFQLPAMAGEELTQRIADGIDDASVRRLTASVEAGRGVILSLPHSGNWDMAGVYLVNEFGAFTTVAERLQPESLFDAFVAYRRGLGFDVLALTGGDVPPMSYMERVLRSGGIVCLLGERDLTDRGVVVDFFGEPASMPAGPALLAQRTGAALHVVHLSFAENPERWVTTVGEPVDTSGDVADVVQRQATEYARNIAGSPADWHMLQPVWLADLSERRRERILRANAHRRTAADGGEVTP